jgi:tetratricopeptide (TPR) repeat protein
VDWNFAQAEQEFQRAIALVPDAPAHHWRGQNLIILERFAEAEQELRRAQILDPTSLMITDDLAENFYYWRRYDDAAEQARAMLALEPRHTSAIFIMGWVYTQKGMYAQALAGYEELTPSLIVWKEKGMGAIYAVAGDKEKALKVEADLEARSAPATYIAPIYAALGDKDKASLG